MSRGKAFLLARKALSPSSMFWLMAAWVFLYATLAIWTKEAFARYMERLPESLLLQAPFLVFIIIAISNYFDYAVPRVRASWLKAPFWLMAPTGLLLFLTGFFISAVFSDAGRLFVGTDSRVQPPWQDEPYVVTRIDTGLKDEIIDMGEGEGIIFSLSPRLFIKGGGLIHEVGVFPPTKVGQSYFHIMDFGLAPGVRIERDGEVLREGYVIQKVLPPGLRDSFEVSPFPYRFAIRMLPEREVVKGRERFGVYNLKAPRYSVVIEKGEKIVFQGDTAAPIELDGLSISFYGTDYWFWLEGAKNPGYMLLAAGMALSLAGIPMLLAAMGYRALSGLLQASRAGKN
jgi:hypothetical protein